MPPQNRRSEGVPVAPTSGDVPGYNDATADAQTTAWADPNSPTYKGPGFMLGTDKDGRIVLQQKVGRDGKPDPVALIEQNRWESDQAAKKSGDTVGVDSSTANPPAPATNDSLNPYPELSPIIMPSFQGLNPVTPRVAVTSNRPSSIGGVNVSQTSRDALGRVTTDPNANAPGAQAPDIDRSKIDPLFDDVNKYQGRFDTLFNQVDSLGSVAEAQLQQSQKLALQRNAIQQEQASRGALGAARSVRNRGDRAAAERQAIGESTFLGQEKARTDALQQTEYEGNLAALRANEENEKIKLKQGLTNDAIESGMNQAALELDISKADTASANNWINNEFEQLGLNKKLNEQQTESMMGYAKDMAMLQFQYDKLSSDEQQALEQMIMDKWHIEGDWAVAYKKIKEENNYDWYSTVNSFIGGASQGAGSVIGTAAVASDIRAKKDISPADLEDLMGSLKAMNFNYKDPDKHGEGPQTGVMAQDLQKSSLGDDMVSQGDGGTLQVDGGKAGTVALAGLSMIYDKLKEIESRLG